MISPNTLLYFGITVAIIYLIAKKCIKHFDEIKISKQLNTKPVYKKLSIEDRLIQRKELENLLKVDFQNYYDRLFSEKDFINKNTVSLNQFIINDEINDYDLHKLAQLNGIKIEMNKGWNQLVLRLIVELNEMGWNRKVSSIKEKFGELRFYASGDYEKIVEKYTEKSKTICEICGNSGNFYTVNSWDFTRCDAHRNN